MKKKVFLFVLVFSLIIGTLLGCSPNEDADTATGGSDGGDIIKIGVFEPMTGAAAAGGEMTVEGIELANEKVSSVLGKDIELVIVDNKSEKVEAANAVSRLVDKDEVTAIIGSYACTSSS